jgi:hypothetical protein
MLDTVVARVQENSMAESCHEVEFGGHFVILPVTRAFTFTRM